MGAGQPQVHYFLTDGGGRLISYTDRSGADKRVSFNWVYNDRAIHAGAIAHPESFGASAREAANLADISYFRNRYYDQRTGRWLTEDPIGVAGGTNLYGYVGNNPVMFTDPFGLCKKAREDAICIDLFIEPESGVNSSRSTGSIRWVWANAPRVSSGELLRRAGLLS